MSSSSRASLIKRLGRGRESRAQFVSSHIDKTISFQLRAIRERQELSQEKLAEMSGMNQNAISRLESDWYAKATLSTLKRLAAALDVALIVRFVPFGQLVDWVTGNPFVDTGLSTPALAVPSFDEEMSSSPDLTVVNTAWKANRTIYSHYLVNPVRLPRTIAVPERAISYVEIKGNIANTIGWKEQFAELNEYVGTVIGGEKKYFDVKTVAPNPSPNTKQAELPC